MCYIKDNNRLFFRPRNLLDYKEVVIITSKGVVYYEYRM